MRNFQKQALTPNRLRAAGRERLDDAKCLLASEDRSRCNGAMYLAGFAIECQLKALLLERHKNLAVRSILPTLSESDRSVRRLLYNHELDEMLDYLPEVQEKIVEIFGMEQWVRFQGICAQWTVLARYSTYRPTRVEASGFIDDIQEVLKWVTHL